MIPKKETPLAAALIVLKIDVHFLLVYITTLSTKGGVLPRRVMAPVVRYLKDSDDIRYVALTATKDRGSLITIRVSKKDRYTASDDYLCLNDGLQDHEDNPVTFAEHAIKALTLQDKETLLLGVAWITEEGT
jgi:hypothetical protein